VLKDRERRAWEAAAGELVRLSDPRAAADFEALLAAKADPADRAKVERWLAELRSRLEAKASR
jgi:hypothetical protein